MSSLSRELVFLILQFLDEEKYKDTVSSLERESGVYFNMKHFEDLVLNGEWDAVEKYIAGFTRVEDNRYSMKIYFEIRKQKYLEALDRSERGKAAEILMKDLKVFASFNEDLFKEITHLITLEDFRQNEQLSKYGDTKSARNIMLAELKKLVDANPLFRDKLLFPPLRASRLRSLINQSLNWQHQLCKNPLPNPDIKTLFTDHTCAPSSGARAPPPVNGPTIGPLSKGVAFQTATPHGMLTVQPIQQAVSPSSTLGGWMATLNPSVVPSPLSILPPPNTASFMKHPRTNAALDYQADSEQILKRMRSSHPDEVLFSGPVYSHDDLPRTTVRTLQQGSSITSFDFHPLQHTVLLVGTSIGDMSVWEVGSRERLAHRGFKIWDTSVCPVSLQAALMKDPSISVNRCRWSPDGSIVGAAFSKHLIHTYFFGHNGELRPQLEIDAHIGGVNDLAFAYPNKSLLIISCGDDKTIKVWNASTGQRENIFEGHNAPVYSVCPHSKENINFIFSTAFDGKIKAWLYDCAVPRVDYDAPGLACTVMAYSSDGSRLFSCGSGKEGDSHLVEWNESEGTVKRSYSGFRKRSPSMVQFDTMRNRILAAGDDFMIKFWDMDGRDVVATTEADGGLAGSPRLKFNKDGSLLAVSTIDNGFKILANTDGLRLIRLLESRVYESFRSSTQQINSKVHLAGVPHVSVTIATTADKTLAPVQAPAVNNTFQNTAENSRTSDVRHRVTDDSEKLKGWKLADVVDPKQLKAITLPDSAMSGKIMRLLFTNIGSAVLALSSNAMHKLWKWQCTDKKSPPKCTPSVLPQLWQPASGITMSNDTTDINADDLIACMALSKNDSYIMSASGGKVSLYNMISFKVMTSFMLPPPKATFLAFHPVDNNILAIGMDDSTILIYNVRVDEVKSTLKAHQKRITGLAFSQTMNALVSSGADAQICMWSINGWEKKKSRFIKSPVGQTLPLTGDTSVQFNNDQTRIFVSHETQLAIYDSNFDCLLSWMPRETLPAAISCGVYSSDGALIYAGFADGAIGVFHSESLSLCCRIAPSSYARGTAYPTVIAVHPGEANQIAVGMSDGAVHLMEPADSDSGTASSTHASDAALSR